MATLRPQQLDEILNYDRTINRQVLDRTIAQVSSFNDERAQPTQRDIKLETVIGSLVDKLKASIADALKLIAAKQFPEVNASNANITLTLPTGERGLTANASNQEARRRNAATQATEADSGSESGPETAEQQTQAGDGNVDGSGKAFDKAIKNANKREANDNNNSNGYSFAFTPVDVETRMKDDLEYVDDLMEKMGTTRTIGMGFGKMMIRRKKLKGGATPEDSTMKGATTKISVSQNTQTVENALYNIMIQYNGIIDKILEATQQGGVLQNRRLASASTVSYFANIIKGLNEPLKHMLYEISMVRDKDIASMFNLVQRMIDVIDQSPPFQKIDFDAYRKPIENYQSMNRNLPIYDYGGKLAELKKQKEQLTKALEQTHKQSTHILYGLKDKPQSFKDDANRRLKETYKSLEDAIGKVNDDITEVRRRRDAGLLYGDEGETIDRDAINKSRLIANSIKQAQPDVDRQLPVPQLEQEIIDELIKMNGDTATEIHSMDVLSQKQKTSVLGDAEYKLVQDAQTIATKYKQFTGRVLGQVHINPEIKTLTRDLNKELNHLDRLANSMLDVHQRQKNPPAEEVDADQAIRDQAGGTAVGAPDAGAPASGSGMGGYCGNGKPLADLLAKPKQQYNSMGRPLSDNDNIHRKVVKEQQNWDSKIPVHYNPIGSKNPFYAQQSDAKYDFPSMLRKENNDLHPRKNALGADVSLLQGEIGGPTEYAPEKRKYRKPQREVRTAAEALQNILNQNVYGSGKSGALKKLVFDDEANDMFDGEEPVERHGFIKEDEDDQFKLPDVKKELKKKHNRL